MSFYNIDREFHSNQLYDCVHTPSSEGDLPMTPYPLPNPKDLPTEPTTLNPHIPTSCNFITEIQLYINEEYIKLEIDPNTRWPKALTHVWQYFQKVSFLGLPDTLHLGQKLRLAGFDEEFGIIELYPIHCPYAVASVVRILMTNRRAQDNVILVFDVPVEVIDYPPFFHAGHHDTFHLLESQKL